jgi:hypothetical protein
MAYCKINNNAANIMNYIYCESNGMSVVMSDTGERDKHDRERVGRHYIERQ